MKYFDKTFWKMTLGFIAMVLVSLVILISVKVYESRPVDQENNIAQTTK